MHFIMLVHIAAYIITFYVCNNGFITLSSFSVFDDLVHYFERNYPQIPLNLACPAEKLGHDLCLLDGQAIWLAG